MKQLQTENRIFCQKANLLTSEYGRFVVFCVDLDFSFPYFCLFVCFCPHSTPHFFLFFFFFFFWGGGGWLSSILYYIIVPCMQQCRVLYVAVLPTGRHQTQGDRAQMHFTVAKSLLSHNNNLKQSKLAARYDTSLENHLEDKHSCLDNPVGALGRSAKLFKASGSIVPWGAQSMKVHWWGNSRVLRRTTETACSMSHRSPSPTLWNHCHHPAGSADFWFDLVWFGLFVCHFVVVLLVFCCCCCLVGFSFARDQPESGAVRDQTCPPCSPCPFVHVPTHRNNSKLFPWFSCFGGRLCSW